MPATKAELKRSKALAAGVVLIAATTAFTATTYAIYTVSPLGAVTFASILIATAGGIYYGGLRGEEDKLDEGKTDR